MSALLKLLKISSITVNSRTVPHRAIRTTPALSWLNAKLSKFRKSEAKEQKYMEMDRVPPTSQLIYRLPMEGYVAWSVNVSTLTASAITLAALYQYANNAPILDSLEGVLVVHNEDVYYFALGFVAINTALRLVVSMLPQRIYKDSGKYLAIFYPQLPGFDSRHAFNQGEVKKVEYVFNPWNNITYKLGTKASLVFEDYFKTPSEFHEMATKKEK